MLRELKTFLAVVRHGTFSAAGAAVGLTQSAVSTQIRNLEADIGEPLFERTGRAVKLNAAGRRLLPQANEMLALAERIRHPSAEGPSGEWHLGAIASLQSGRLPALLQTLADEAPGVMTRVVPGVSLALLDQVDKGDLDMALIVRPPFDLPGDLHTRVIAREPFVLIAPLASRGVTLRELLADHPLVLYDRGSFGGRQVVRYLERQRLRPDIRLELDEIDAIARMVEQGLGVALIPMTGLWQRQRPLPLRVLPLEEEEFYRELVMVSRLPPAQSPLVAIIERELLRLMEAMP
ncbi:LysR family transcriptional regulator [Salinicola avicenniae]|uniref:LysR family transcriptional regulator n=1 Tax=Salinicola avicenniae TaxID=2916836 RepID=UPI002073D67E|nr:MULTISPECIES: LysR family transcriptional regulator [unclassified Salinicola]